MIEFALCETMTAGSSTRWHIRRLTEVGKKLGGADTKALCGREVSWDLNMQVTTQRLDFCCLACRAVYDKQ